ncbi:MAG TPA: helix-turn-helix domain-containing protein [Gaiellaceae bacterium]
MAARVKSKRRYESPRRRAQAAETRRQMLEGAQRLFEERGYAATTMAAIAVEADVALKTVYVAFESKSGVLRALWNLLLRGDESEAPVAERAWYRKVLDEPDPRRQLRLAARASRAVKERVGAVLGVIRSAATVDAEIAALWSRIQTEFYANQGAIVESLQKKKALRPGLDVARATDILWTLNHPDVWLLLIGERGWTPEQWERWFGDTICEQLLRDPDRGRQATRKGRARRG